MNELLKLFLKKLMISREGLTSIATVQDLCDAVAYTDDLVKMLFGMNDDRDGFDTAEILLIANEAYQEVLANV